jgi:hypothetical protein
MPGARRLGRQPAPDGTRLGRVDPAARFVTKTMLREHPQRFVRRRAPGSLTRSTILRRYRTGDRVLPGNGAPCPCGRVFPTVQAVLGRQERSVTLPDGRIVARLDRVFQRPDRHLIEGQVLYANDGSFRLRVVAGPGFSALEEAALVRAFLLRTGGGGSGRMGAGYSARAERQVRICRARWLNRARKG